MSFIGNTPTQQSFTAAVDVFSGNGSTTAFTLSRPVASVAQVEAFIENVPQSPVDAFTVNGSTITFTSAPPSGSSNIYVRYTSPITQVIQPSDGSVGLNTLSSAVMSAIGGMGFKNRIINGAMMIDQRNAGASVTPINSQYLTDRFYAGLTQASKFTVQQNAGAVTPPAGFKNYLGVTSSSAYSVLTGDTFYVGQAIEGYNIADLGWGAASAQTVTLSFWVRSSLTGTFGGAITNATARSYPFSYTISAANTWEQKTVTVAGDTSGTWGSTNGVGLVVWFGLGSGSTYSGTSGVWSSSVLVQPTGSTSVVGTSGATFYITGVDLRKGSVGAYSNGQNDFDYRPYGTELALCQRYYIRFATALWAAGYGEITNKVGFAAVLPVSMRSQPSLANDADSSGLVANGNLYNVTANSAVIENAWWNGNNGVISVTTNSQVTRWTTAWGRVGTNLQLSAEL